MNTDKQPQIEKTAAEFLFESGINTMSLNDDFNCQLLFAMERYAEHYASNKRYIKIDDSTAFKHTDKQTQTVYVRCGQTERNDASLIFPLTHDKSFLNGMPFPVKEIPNVYLITPKELEALKAKWQNDKPKDLIEWIEKEGLPMSKDILRELKLSRLARKFGYSSVDEAINDLDNPLPQPPKP